MYIFIIYLINYHFISLFVRSANGTDDHPSIQTETFLDRHIPVGPPEKILHHFLAIGGRDFSTINNLAESISKWDPPKTTLEKNYPRFLNENRYNII